MPTIKRFEDFNCWQLARAISQQIYSLTRRGEMAKDFGLRNQISRASDSVIDNIAAAFDRGSRGEFLQFPGYAKGSAGEVKSQLYRSLDQSYLSQEAFDLLAEMIDHTSSSIKQMQFYLNGTSIRGERFHKAEEPAGADAGAGAEAVPEGFADFLDFS